MKLKLNQTVVVPSHGLATVSGFETRECEGAKREFVKLTTDINMILFYPVDFLKSAGVRPTIDPNLVPQVNELLLTPVEGFKDNRLSWQRRYRAYREQLATGDIWEVVDVVRQLRELREHKALSFGERKMLEQAESLLFGELKAAACNG